MRWTLSAGCAPTASVATRHRTAAREAATEQTPKISGRRFTLLPRDPKNRVGSLVIPGSARLPSVAFSGGKASAAMDRYPARQDADGWSHPLAFNHSITRSARWRMADGKLIPWAFAVLRLSTNS